MIVQMKKISVVVLDTFRDETLKKLAQAGVLHIQNEPGKSDTLSGLLENRETLSKALAQLPLEKSEKTEKTPGQENADTVTALELSKHVLRKAEEMRGIRERLERISRERERLRPWGNFNPGDIRWLRDAGIDVRLYEIPLRSFLSFGSAPSLFTIHRTKTIVYGMAVNFSAEQVPEEWQETPLPAQGLEELQKESDSLEGKTEEIRREFQRLSGEVPRLRSAMLVIDRQIEFEGVRTGFGVDGPLAYLSGFVPIDTVNDVKKLAQQNGWGILVRDPDESDRVPTLVRNSKAVRIIQPVFDLLGTIPGYHENDISLSFLIFFGFFFAMIIGDAGYGTILLIGALIALFRGKGSPGNASPAIGLLFVLSICTLIWGALTGTWFGSETLAGVAPFKYLVVDAIGSFQEESAETVKLICFIVGTIQLSLAHIWNFLKEVRKKPLIRSFAQLGWLSTVLGLFYLVLNLVLDPQAYPIPSYALYMMGTGLAAVILFSNQEGNFFKGVLKGFSGFITTFLDGISAFSDIISYIRLFAVGLASVEIAKSFNTMAAGLGNGAVAIIGGILIVLFGHSLNLAMGALSVIVHGVRLNMLEFSSHLGMEWTGIPFKPFGRTNS